ncbi:TPA: hypothetical protein N0F65_000918 [Lagenidium giganteum]|uniref:FYVE-type domain-containing protein n=1 Tax=Lagenidium giganteum TaxID=4803 RepID=A0AAV2YMP1_9STRA|nr:TPA: hypothetical protein N0F65_000918 [Lagenidium giganteum]
MPKASLYTTTNSAFSATNSLQGQLMQANLLCQDRLEATARQYRLRQDRQQASTPTKTTTKQPSSVQIAASFRDPQWKHVRSRSDIRVFRHAQRNNGVSTMMATGLLHGSLHDVMDGLYAESSKELRVLHTLLSDRILDSAMLFVDEVRSQAETYRFAGVQWMVIKAPNTIGLCKDRDFCCYKQTGVFTDEHGNDVGFLVLQSMESVDQCALTSKMDANGYIRGHISIACQFRPLKDDLVEVFMHGDVDAKGKLPSRLAEAAFAETFLSIANAFESGEAKKLSLLLSSPVEQRVPGGVHAAILAKKLNDRCDLCTATATFWNPHDYCRGCYHRVCRRCRVDKPIFCAHYHRSHAATQRRRPCTETFCLECVCSVVDSSIQMNAKLMRQQQKRREHSQRSLRRERTGTASTEGSLFNVSSSASSYTETPEKSEQAPPAPTQCPDFSAAKGAQDRLNPQAYRWVHKQYQ